MENGNCQDNNLLNLKGSSEKLRILLLDLERCCYPSTDLRFINLRLNFLEWNVLISEGDLGAKY